MRGAFDEEAKKRKLFVDRVKKEENNSDNKKDVKFDFDKNEVKKFDKKESKWNSNRKKEEENENEEENIKLKNQMQHWELDDIEKLNEIFKRIK